MIGSHSLLLYVLCYMKFRRPNITQHCITMHPVPTAERYRLSHPRSKSHRLFTVWILLFCRYTVTVCLSTQQSADYRAPERTYRLACHSDKWTKRDIANSWMHKRVSYLQNGISPAFETRRCSVFQLRHSDVRIMNQITWRYSHGENTSIAYRLACRYSRLIDSVFKQILN